MNCTNCGKELIREAKFCDGCGSPIVSREHIQETPVNEQASKKEDTVNTDENNNKVIFIFSYILFFLPLLTCPNSKTGRFHANQGLLLLLTSIGGKIIVMIISKVIISVLWTLWPISSLITWAWNLAILALIIIGMLNANNGLKKPLPIIGNFMIIKQYSIICKSPSLLLNLRLSHP